MQDDPTLTLREGLSRFRELNAKHVAEREQSAEASAFFRHHDVAHVVFACDTTLTGEGRVKLFTIWGTTLGLRGHLRGYTEGNAFSLFRQYSLRHVLRQLASVLGSVPTVWRRSRRMHRRWPWSDYDAYLDVPLGTIRRELNIQVLREP
ncbi:MAG: hypothetical protein AAF184_16860 [Pseudomonadota bacterium]